MNKKSAVLAMFATMCLSFSIFGQSPLSVQYPGGLPQVSSTGPSIAIGGAGTGVQNDYFGFADNPGNLGATNRLVFSGLLSYNTTFINQGAESDHVSSFAPRLFSFEFPISSIGTFGFSLDQRSISNFSMDSIIPTTADSIHQTMVGGIKSWQIGYGRSLNGISFGISYERLYYSSNLTNLYPITYTGAPFCDSSSVTAGSNGIRAGILIPIQKFTFGLSGEYVFKGTGTRKQNNSRNVIVTGDNSAPDTIAAVDSNFSLTLPPSLSAGLSYVPSQNWLIAGSVTATFWNRFSSTLPLGVDTVQEAHNTLSFSLGAQYIPAPNMLLPHYWQVVQYRGGLRYSQLPDGHSSEFAVDAGFGLPLLKGNGLVDVIATYGRRYDDRFSGYGENFLQFSLGINAGRSWSQNTGVRY